MKLWNQDLEAFYEVAKVGSFSKAANKLFLTQSALSQRVAKLESEMEHTLFIRKRSQLLLTPMGENLLRYCRNEQGLQNEFLGQIKNTSDGLAGQIRLATYSSILRSIVIPSLAPFLRKNPRLQVEFSCHEMNELAPLLKSAAADIVITDYQISSKEVENLRLGKEEYVHIQSQNKQAIKDIYLDHGPHDRATEEFFKYQNWDFSKEKRAYMGDVYGVLDGVVQGLGMAVMSRHLLKGIKGIKITKSPRRLKKPVIAHYYKQAYYSPLLLGSLEVLKNNFSTRFFIAD